MTDPPTPRWWQVVDELTTRIADGRYAPGDQLPGENDLALELDVGRDTLREALRWLAIDGVVELRRGYRARVREREHQTVVVPRGSELIHRHPTEDEQRERGLHPAAVMVEVRTGGQEPAAYEAMVTTFTFR